MIILGIESAGLVASAALVGDESILAEYSLNTKQTHSQTLLPMIEAICAGTGINENMNSIDGIAIAAGPGSFTGLRIGAATAKGLAFSIDKPVICVPTVDAMAYRMWGNGGYVCPIMDARRSQVYTGVFSFVKETDKTFPQVVYENGLYMETVLSQCVISIEELCVYLNKMGKEVTFLGDACPVAREKIEALLTCPYRFAPAFMSRQSAAAVAGLGALYYRNGKIEDAYTAGLEYLRPSQAERVRDEKLADKRND